MCLAHFNQEDGSSQTLKWHGGKLCSTPTRFRRTHLGRPAVGRYPDAGNYFRIPHLQTVKEMCRVGGKRRHERPESQ
jgi:hypothetical protein